MFPEPNYLKEWTSCYTDLDSIVHQFSLITDIQKISNKKTIEEMFKMSISDLYSYLLQCKKTTPSAKKQQLYFKKSC